MVGVAPFVGREAERRAIAKALGQARAGAGAVLVLTGAAGIGKTRLADEVATAAPAPYLVIWATCGPAGTMPAYWPWTQALGDLLRGHDDLRRRAEREWPAAVRLADARHRPEPPAGAADREQARAELYEDVVALLTAAAAEQPLLVVLDDLHNGDPSSWLLVAHLAPRLRALPVVILATWRTGEVRPSGATATDLLRRGQVVALAPLGVEPLAALLAGVAGREIDPSLAAAVHRRTSGNPLLAQEVLLALDAHGGRADAAAVAAIVPESTRALVGERLLDLGPETRAALSAAAVVGTTFRLDVLAEALGQDDLSLLDALGPAAGAGVVTSLGPVTGTFSNALVRDVVLELDAPASRARLNDRVGEALERLRADGRAVEPVDLARHFLAAGPSAASRAAVYATEAGRRAMAMLAYEEAVTWFTHAAHLTAAAGGAAGRAELLLALGDAQEASGDRAGSRSTYLDAAGAARAAGRADLLASAALGMSGTVGFEVTMLDRQQIDLLGEALDGLASDELARRASVMARLAVAVSFLDGVDRRARLTEEAVELARASGDGAALVQALAARCDAISGPEHASARLALAAEIVDLAARLRDPRLELLGRRLSVVALMEQGDFDATDREIQAFATTAAALRRPVYSWYVPLWRSMRAAMDGRLDEAWAALADAQAMGRESDSENAVMLTTTLRWHLLSEVGDADAVAELLAGSGLETFPGVWPLVTRSLCAAQTGRPGPARALLDSAAARLPGAERDSEWLPMVCQVSEIVGIIGPHPAAEWAYDTLLPHRRLFAVEGIGAAVRGPVERALGTLAAALGRPEDAAAHFEAAVRSCERIGATLLVARIRLVAGAGLHDRAQLIEAGRLYRDLGVDRLIAEVDGLLDGAADTGAGATAPEPGGANVFRREGEVWRLVHAGREVRLRDSKGLRDLARLLAEPGRPFPAVELAGAIGPARANVAADGLYEPGDLGELIDATARDAYRRRLADLDEEIDDADRAADTARSSRAIAEKDALVAQLSAAYGLGGRPRRAGDPAERARQTVTARVRDAISRVEAVHPDLGRHLRRSVRTGRTCAYEPDSPIEWSS